MELTSPRSGVSLLCITHRRRRPAGRRFKQAEERHRKEGKITGASVFNRYFYWVFLKPYLRFKAMDSRWTEETSVLIKLHRLQTQRQTALCFFLLQVISCLLLLLLIFFFFFFKDSWLWTPSSSSSSEPGRQILSTFCVCVCVWGWYVGVCRAGSGGRSRNISKN